MTFLLKKTRAPTTTGQLKLDAPETRRAKFWPQPHKLVFNGIYLNPRQNEANSFSQSNFPPILSRTTNEFSFKNFCLLLHTGGFQLSRVHTRTTENAGDGGDISCNVFRRCFEKIPFSHVHTRNGAF